MILLRNFEETAVNDRTKNKKNVQGKYLVCHGNPGSVSEVPSVVCFSGEVKKPGTLHVQIMGDLLKTDLFELKDPISDDDNLDKFSKTDYNLGQVSQFLRTSL